MSYLIYTTESAAWARSETEGQHRNLPYHRGEGTTRYVTAPQQAAEGEWALDVIGYDLTEDEQAATVETFEAPVTDKLI